MILGALFVALGLFLFGVIHDLKPFLNAGCGWLIGTGIVMCIFEFKKYSEVTRALNMYERAQKRLEVFNERMKQEGAYGFSRSVEE